jgi:hypothetical protein
MCRTTGDVWKLETSVSSLLLQPRRENGLYWKHVFDSIWIHLVSIFISQQHELTMLGWLMTFIFYLSLRINP